MTKRNSRQAIRTFSPWLESHLAMVVTERSDASSEALPEASAAPPIDADRLLVERARRGDVEAFEQLYRRHVGRIHATCRRLCGDVSEAEEMTQEAFVRAWQKLDTFRGQSLFSSWLHRLSVNVVLGHWRSAKRYRQRVVAIDDVGSAPEPEVEVPEGLAIDLERAIATLPPGARTVFVLHDIEGWRHRDIAEQVGLAVGTSKTQLHRARRLLRRVLDGDRA
ncbi:MAG: RNA polymerase sigma factor [Acidobacteriota bacterium]